MKKNLPQGKTFKLGRRLIKDKMTATHFQGTTSRRPVSNYTHMWQQATQHLNVLELDPHSIAAQWFHFSASWDHSGWTIVVGFCTHAQSGMLQNCHYTHIVISGTAEGKQGWYEGVQQRDHSSRCAHAAPRWAASEDAEIQELQAPDLLKKCRIWNEATKDPSLWAQTHHSWLQTDQATCLLRNSISSTGFTSPLSASMYCALGVFPTGRDTEQSCCRKHTGGKQQPQCSSPASSRLHLGLALNFPLTSC